MKKRTIDAETFYRIREISRLKDRNVIQKLEEFLETVKPQRLRTSLQNRALHKDCDLIAEKLNDAGWDMKKVIKKELDIPWTTESVKKWIFKPIMKAMYNKESTTELEKNSGEIDKVHDVIMRELGEKFGIEYHPFPHDPEKKKQMEEMMAPIKRFGNYPEEDAKADKF